MTTPLVPDFIVKLFEKEITAINYKILETICSTYSIDFGQAKETLKNKLNINLDIITNDICKMKITKKRSYGKKTLTENRCIGRVYHILNNDFAQCIRKKQDGCNTCKTHSQRCPYGTIHDPEPELKAVQKRNIY